MTSEQVFSQDTEATPVRYEGKDYRVVFIKTIKIEKETFIPGKGPVYEEILPTKYDGDLIVEMAMNLRPTCRYCNKSLHGEHLHNGYEEVLDAFGNYVRVCRNCLVPFEISQLRIKDLGE